MAASSDTIVARQSDLRVFSLKSKASRATLKGTVEIEN